MKGMHNNVAAMELLQSMTAKNDNRIREIYNMGYNQGYRDGLKESVERIVEYVEDEIKDEAEATDGITSAVPTGMESPDDWYHAEFGGGK